MSKVFYLFKMELFRLYKYKIIFFSLLTSLIWFIAIYFSKKEEILGITPSLIFLDSSMMSTIFLAASFFFEKQEETIKTILVTPVKLKELLIAKVISAIFLAITSALIIALSTIFIHNISINIPLLIFYVILIVISHTSIGYAITLYSKDFMSMLLYYSLFTILFLLPVFLVGFNVFPESMENIMLISPSQSGLIILNSTVLEIDKFKIIFSIIYLLVISSTFYPFVVFKKYKKIAIGE